MTNSTSRNFTGAIPDEGDVMRNDCIHSNNADASNLDDASASVETEAAAVVTTIPTRRSSRDPNETSIESQESLSSVRNSNLVSDDERLSAAVREVVHPEFEAVRTTIDALGAELESFKISERQSSAEAGPQTSAGGDDGAPNALGTPQGPEQCVYCGGPLNQGRIAQGGEINQKARGYGKYVGILCILVAIFYLLVCNLGTDLKDFQWSNIIARLSAVAKPPTINCDSLETIAAFCRDKEGCVGKTSSYCTIKHFHEMKGIYAKHRLELKEVEDEIIAKYM